MPDKTYTFPENLSEYELFIFDLDGTLYDQNYLRKKIIRSLLWHLARFKVTLTDLKIIQTFRIDREDHKAFAKVGIDEEQYDWTAEKLGLSTARVRQVIEHWMLSFPLPLLLAGRYPYVEQVFDRLKLKQKKIAVFSDFPVDSKLEALGLSAHKTYCSTYAPIEQLKPSASGVELISKDFSCKAEKVIYFGDREDTDGESARLAGVSFVKVVVEAARKGEFYADLLSQLTTNYD